MAEISTPPYYPIREDAAKRAKDMSAGAWQWQLNNNALYAAKHLDFLQPVSDEGLSEDSQDELGQEDGGMQMGV